MHVVRYVFVGPAMSAQGTNRQNVMPRSGDCLAPICGHRGPGAERPLVAEPRSSQLLVRPSRHAEHCSGQWRPGGYRPNLGIAVAAQPVIAYAPPQARLRVGVPVFAIAEFRGAPQWGKTELRQNRPMTDFAGPHASNPRDGGPQRQRSCSIGRRAPQLTGIR